MITLYVTLPSLGASTQLLVNTSPAERLMVICMTPAR